MLKTIIKTVVWQCDSCQTEINSELNPYFNIIIQNPVLIPNLPICEIDLCLNCIRQITTQKVIDYVANSKPE